MFTMTADVKTLLELKKIKVCVDDEEISVLDYIDVLENTIRRLKMYNDTVDVMEYFKGSKFFEDLERMDKQCQTKDELL